MLIKQVGSIKHDEWWWVERKSYQGQKEERITTAINNIATFMTKNKILSQFFNGRKKHNLWAMKLNLCKLCMLNKSHAIADDFVAHVWMTYMF